VVTAATWIAGGVLFRITDERHRPLEAMDYVGVTVLIPAYNEEAVIATSVEAALASEYPLFEVIVLDDGSTDDTKAAAEVAAARLPNGHLCRVRRDEVNRGKAEQLNAGFHEATYEFVVVSDADAHVHPHALRHLAERMNSSPLLAAVVGAPHVTNRTRLICAMQVLEAAAVISLIRRTQSLTGRVGTVAGVLGMFHRDRVLQVGGYDAKMATEDIDLTWRLLIAGWHSAYEPQAPGGMEVPSKVSALWEQRKRWARGQGEVLHKNGYAISRWRNRRTWMLGIESLASLLWIVLLTLSVVIAVLDVTILGEAVSVFGLSLAWGVAISVVATIQLLVAEALRYRHDHWDPRSLLIGALYPPLFWLFSGFAALRCQVGALIRGPRERRVVWDIPRERVTP
jgi:biofilm PGA synthesis N-glycosyltransferase PgaC